MADTNNLPTLSGTGSVAPTCEVVKEARRLRAVLLEKQDEESRQAFLDFIIRHGIGAGLPDADD